MKSNINILAFSFGLASIVGQVALLREFLSLFSGDEIIIGLFLAFWMLLVGVGAFIGIKVKPVVKLHLLPILLAIAFAIGLLVLYISQATFVTHGAEPGFLTVVIIVLISLIPSCITIGYAFTRFSSETVTSDLNWSISRIYIWEQLGSSIGGGMLYLLLIQWFNSVQIVIFVVVFLFINAVYVSGLIKTKKIIITTVIGLSGLLLIVLPIQKLLRELGFRSEKIITLTDTPYGNVTVTKSGSQINIYENGNLRGYAGEVQATEENVHAVMLRHQNPHKVLMIGGATIGTFKEFEKYKNVDVDYVDINPAIINIVKQSENENVRFIVSDPFRFLKEIKTKYDVIILNTGFPHNLQDNRFFSKEFFTMVKRGLNSNGLLGVRGLEKQFHIEDNYMTSLSTIASTGKSVFDNYDVFPGNNIWFLFFDKAVLPLFDERYSDICKKNLWFNSDYILPDLTEDERLQYIKEIKLNMTLNTCFNPILLEQSIAAKSGYWHINRYLSLYLITGLFIVVFMFFSRRAKTMAVAGFVLSGVQLLLIYSMQIVAGNLYEILGVIFALSMSGMALGGWLHKKFIYKTSLKLEFLLLIAGALILLLPFVLIALVSVGMWYAFQIMIVYLLVLLFSFLSGVLFSGVTYNTMPDKGRLAGSIYGADMLGSASGVLLTSLFLIPIAGIINTAFILGLICIVVGLLLFRV